MKTRQTGFTLVEIAIVLVIIGLLLGGILKGQEMIIQAKVKNSLTDFSGVSAAFYGYQDRYRAIPGDDAGAGRWAGAIAGDGNRILVGLYNAADVPVPVAGTAETILWWDHLRRSGFVTGGQGGAKPINSFNGILGAQQGDGSAAPVAVLPTTPAGTDGFTNLMLCSSSLPDKVAIALDVQMDDGFPDRGAVRSTPIQTAPAPTLAAAATAYQENGTNLYTLCRQF
jgi:prepilin-type N-terminal cleavage/methylation domain-containing protein